MTLTREQVRGARHLLGWSQADLAGFVGVSRASVIKLEQGGPWRKTKDLVRLRTAFETAGVEFPSEMGGEGRVRLRGAPVAN